MPAPLETRTRDSGLQRRNGSLHSEESSMLQSPVTLAGSVETDREVLLKLFQTTHGKLWTHRGGWAELKELGFVGSCHGITTNEEGRVEQLELQGFFVDYYPGNNVIGFIPPLLGRLDALTVLNLTGNKIYDAIPSTLGELRGLKHLRLGFNQLSGTIPPELGQLSNLQVLDLTRNRVTGDIPPELGKLSSVELLNLCLNDLRGTIPKELGNLKRAERIILSKNKLCGTIPSELGNLSSLQFLDIAWNKLHGAIPPELGRLRALHKLSLRGNRLSGPIPKELGQLGNLNGLYVNDNELSGLIPPELGALTALQTLVLSGNQLRGTIPKELGHMKSLRHLHINDNKLTSLGRVEDALRLIDVLFSRPSLRNNPWIMPPEAIVEKKGALANYFRDVQKAEQTGALIETIQLLKVVLVGSSQAGKTSLVRSIIHGFPSRTEGTPTDVSTVGIDLLRHQLKGTTVEFYDCAGQVDYAGMHQIFLSKRALYLLVWDVRKCHGKAGKALDEVISEDIMRWLYSLHLRAPGSTVMLVANQCDGWGRGGGAEKLDSTPFMGPTATGNNFDQTARSVQRRAQELLEKWKTRRGFRSHGWVTGSPRGVAGVTLVPEVSLVSCLDGYGLSPLVDRIAAQGAISICVPPAWGLALKVINALRGEEDPLQAAREHLNLSSPPKSPAAFLGGEKDEADSSQSRNPYVTKTDLFNQWSSIVKRVEGELSSAGEKVAIQNADEALEAALWISEYAGQTVRVSNDEGIFLDVVWLSTALSPILSHKVKDEVFSSDFTKMRDELVNSGVLRVTFAEHLWSQKMGGPLEQGVLGALCRVILDLGVALPLDPPNRLGDVDDGPRDMLVIMRLPETCRREQERRLKELMIDERSSGHPRAEETGGGGGEGEHAQQVTLKWRFDWAGPPDGMIERLITSCRAVGDVRQGLCWRYGAAFRSHATAMGEEPGWLYSFVIRYDKTEGGKILSFTMFGPLHDERVWAALRWVASAMINISKEWRGVLWEGWAKCPEGHIERTYLVTPDKAYVGDPLLADAAGPVVPQGCDCFTTKRGVLPLVLLRLGTVVDTQRGDPFARIPMPGTIHIPMPSEEEAASSRCWYNFAENIRFWLPPQRARNAARGFWTTALLFLGTGVSLKETDKVGWEVCLAFMSLFLLGAAIASVVACRYEVQRSRGARGETVGFDDDATDQSRNADDLA